jgi:hypothetical protein
MDSTDTDLGPNSSQSTNMSSSENDTSAANTPSNVIVDDSAKSTQDQELMDFVNMLSGYAAGQPAAEISSTEDIGVLPLLESGADAGVFSLDNIFNFSPEKNRGSFEGVAGAEWIEQWAQPEGDGLNSLFELLTSEQQNV